MKDHRYDYIETGSLISIKKKTKNIRIPSEETRVEMYPMDYEEFRWALGDGVTVDLLREAYEAKRPLGDGVMRKLLRDFRLYMLVGGMPQAVNEYLDTNNLSAVDKVKREIIELYADDFRKIDPTGKATRMFYAVPGQLNKNASRYQISSVIEQGKQDRVEELLQDMEDSKVVLFSHHADDPNVGLSLHEDMGRYKMFYHTWPTESGKHNYEVDFLLSRGAKLWPLEVKSSGYKSHASLDAFCKKFSARVGERFLVYTKDYRKDGATTLLPVVMTMML